MEKTRGENEMKYFVSYSFVQRDKSVLGNYELDAEKPIQGFEDIKMISKLIEIEVKLEQVIILEWKKFEE